MILQKNLVCLVQPIQLLFQPVMSYFSRTWCVWYNQYSCCCNLLYRTSAELGVFGTTNTAVVSACYIVLQQNSVCLVQPIQLLLQPVISYFSRTRCVWYNQYSCCFSLLYRTSAELYVFGTTNTAVVAACYIVLQQNSVCLVQPIQLLFQPVISYFSRTLCVWHNQYSCCCSLLYRTSAELGVFGTTNTAVVSACYIVLQQNSMCLVQPIQLLLQPVISYFSRTRCVWYNQYSCCFSLLYRTSAELYVFGTTNTAVVAACYIVLQQNSVCLVQPIQLLFQPVISYFSRTLCVWYNQYSCCCSLLYRTSAELGVFGTTNTAVVAACYIVLQQNSVCLVQPIQLLLQPVISYFSRTRCVWYNQYSCCFSLLYRTSAELYVFGTTNTAVVAACYIVLQQNSVCLVQPIQLLSQPVISYFSRTLCVWYNQYSCCCSLLYRTSAELGVFGTTNTAVVAACYIVLQQNSVCLVQPIQLLSQPVISYFSRTRCVWYNQYSCCRSLLYRTSAELGVFGTTNTAVVAACYIVLQQNSMCLVQPIQLLLQPVISYFSRTRCVWYNQYSCCRSLLYRTSAELGVFGTTNTAVVAACYIVLQQNSVCLVQPIQLLLQPVISYFSRTRCVWYNQYSCCFSLLYRTSAELYVFGTTNTAVVSACYIVLQQNLVSLVQPIQLLLQPVISYFSRT